MDTTMVLHIEYGDVKVMGSVDQKFYSSDVMHDLAHRTAEALHYSVAAVSGIEEE